jgi:flagellin-like protein
LRFIARRKLKARSRRGSNEVLGTVLLIGFTIAIGFAAWSWARSSAISTENSFGNEINGNINYLNERFEIANANFSTQTVSVWFLNYGNTTVTVKQLWVSNSTWTSPPFAINLQVAQGGLRIATINAGTAFKIGSSYQFKATGQYGNVNYYQQVR